MAVEDVVTILTDYYQSGEDAFEERYGGKALIVVRDILDLLETELEEELQYDALWEGFEADPMGTAADLSGMLEALVEADPGLADQLDMMVGEYHAARGPSEDEIAAGEQSPMAEVVVEPEEKVHPSTGSGRSLDHRDGAGEGAYLYGNVKGGDEEL